MKKNLLIWRKFSKNLHDFGKIWSNFMCCSSNSFLTSLSLMLNFVSPPCLGFLRNIHPWLFSVRALIHDVVRCLFLQNISILWYDNNYVIHMLLKLYYWRSWELCGHVCLVDITTDLGLGHCNQAFNRTFSVS